MFDKLEFGSSHCVNFWENLIFFSPFWDVTFNIINFIIIFCFQALMKISSNITHKHSWEAYKCYMLVSDDIIFRFQKLWIVRFLVNFQFDIREKVIFSILSWEDYLVNF